jgi:hypothetical protein
LKSNLQVFINCPFDKRYSPIRDAIVFAVYDCGYIARSALEYGDASEFRLERIYRLIRESRLAIHDLSRTQLDPTTKLPRFNMPLELGIFLGCKKFGGPKHANKACLVLTKKSYEYQKYLSDISGQDVDAHNDTRSSAIAAVRKWLQGDSGQMMPGPEEMMLRYRRFRRLLPEICDVYKIRPTNIGWNEYATMASEWLELNRWY